MKKLFLYLLLFCADFLMAQNPQLFEHTWYLQNVIIDGNDNLPPSNEEVEFIEAIFYNNNSFETAVCASLSGVLSINADTFYFSSSTVTLIGCGVQANDDYQTLYINNFFEQTINDNYSYSIEQNGSALQLSIINSNNDTSIYSSELLSIDDLLYSEWSLQESSVNGVSISLENSGLPTFYSPNNENFFLHYYGVSCFESFKVNYTDVTETSFNLSTIFDYVSCIYTDPEEIEAVELYQSFYFELPFDTNSTPRNPFAYEWVDAAPFADELRITNNQGDWLLYRTNSLSTPTFQQSSL